MKDTKNFLDNHHKLIEGLFSAVRLCEYHQAFDEDYLRCDRTSKDYVISVGQLQLLKEDALEKVNELIDIVWSYRSPCKTKPMIRRGYVLNQSERCLEGINLGLRDVDCMVPIYKKMNYDRIFIVLDIIEKHSDFRLHNVKT